MSQGKIIWTDNENTRSLLWNAYNGFIEHYNNYQMFLAIGIDHPIVKSGLSRYAVYFYEEIRVFINSIKNLKNAEEIEVIFNNNSFFDNDNLLLVRRFFADFMFYSGIKNILFAKDERDGITKVKESYGV